MACFSSAPLQGCNLHEGTIVSATGQAGAGLGLRATAPFTTGITIYRERPQVFMQSRFSAKAAPACLDCGRILGGSLHEVLERALRCCAGTCVRTHCPSQAQNYPKSLSGYPHLQQSGLLKDSSLKLPCGLPCPKRCGAFFCGESCRSRQINNGHHRVLCMELPQSRKPRWEEFCSHAHKHSETFILAAFVIAQIICDLLYNDCTLDEATAKYTRFYSRPWPEMVKADAPARCARIKRRWSIIKASHDLLMDVLNDCTPPNIEELVSLRGYALFVGMIDLVSKDLERQNPLDAPLKAMLEDLPTRAIIELRKISVLWMTAKADLQDGGSLSSPEDSEDEDPEGRGALSPAAVRERVASLPVLPGFDGFGLVVTVAITNHSCAPNIEVRVSSEPLEVEARALRDISAGEELLMSYLDEDIPRTARQRALWRSYGFRCRCRRCEEEPPCEQAQ